MRGRKRRMMGGGERGVGCVMGISRGKRSVDVSFPGFFIGCGGSRILCSRCDPRVPTGVRDEARENKMTQKKSATTYPRRERVLRV
mmetsp:Transcript_3818/g.14120  ORF Transcript_3818/g.14120 Transcript_3818/m.14120 type:complete len:86 (+) Transcript_3818:523-780(+)